MKLRIQSGCIPYKYDEDGSLKVLVLKKKATGAWGFPKGGIPSKLSAEENAAKECLEEAGVIGKVTDKIGHFLYRKDGMEQYVAMFAMEFDRELDDYLEKDLRVRKWVTLKEAKQLVPKHYKSSINGMKKYVR